MPVRVRPWVQQLGVVSEWFMELVWNTSLQKCSKGSNPFHSSFQIDVIGKDILHAVSLLKKGELVAIPTKTVYGLAANVWNKKAVENIFTIKNRPHDNPLIVHVGSISQLLSLVTSFPPIAQRLAEKFWPGALTLILPSKKGISPLITAGQSTIAIRIPDHAMTMELLQKLSCPLAAPSANIFGNISPTTAFHVDAQLGERLPYILDGGACCLGLESTIVSCISGKPVLNRLGAITEEVLEKVVGKLSYVSSLKTAGKVGRHYSPRTVFLIKSMEEIRYIPNDKKVGLLVFSKPILPITSSRQRVLSLQGSLEEAGRKLFSAMHYLDQQNLDEIWTHFFPNKGLGNTINERLIRASQD